MNTCLSRSHRSIATTSTRVTFTFCLVLVFADFQSGHSYGQLWDVEGIDTTSARYINQVPEQLIFQGQHSNVAKAPNFGQEPVVFGQPRTVDQGAVSGRIFHQPFLEAVFLSRSAISGLTFVIDDNGPVLDPSDLAFELEPGFRVGYNFFTADESGIEFAFLDLSSNFRQTVDGPNVIPIFFGAIPAMPVSAYDIVYDVDLTSFEANYWLRQNQHTRMGLGIRGINLEETFDVLFGTTIDGFFGETDNELYGLQFLIDRKRQIGRGVNVVLSGKFGGYLNDLEIDAVTEGNELHRDDEDFSFVMDYRAGLELQLDFMTKVFFGYQGLFFSNVAVTPTQSDNLSVFAPNAGSIELENSTFNGLYVGGSMTF